MRGNVIKEAEIFVILLNIYITHVLVVDKFTNICPSERRQRMEGDETRSIRHPDGLFRQWPASHLRRCAQQRCRLVRPVAERIFKANIHSL